MSITPTARSPWSADRPDPHRPTPSRPRRPPRRTSCAARTWSSWSPTSRRRRDFYVDVLGLVVTEEDESAVYLRSVRGVHPPQPGAAQGTGGRGRRLRLPRAHAGGPRPGRRVLHRARLPRRASRRRLHDGRRRLACASRTRSGSRTSSSTTSSTSSGSPGATTCTRPGALVRLDHFNQVTPDVPRAVKYMEDLGFRVTEDIQDDGRHHLRRVDAPQADRARHRHDRRRRAAHAPRRVRHAREAQHPRDLRQARRAAHVGPDRARPRPARRLQRVLPLPARPRRPPRRDLHAGLLHGRPGQPGRHLGRPRQPAP